MIKALVLLVLTSFASVALAQPTPTRNAPPPSRVEAVLVAPAQAAEPPAAATQEEQTPSTSPSFFSFLSSSGLVSVAKYCAVDTPDKANQWLHGFICSVRVTDVAIGVYMGLLVLVVAGLVLIGVIQYELFSRSARQQLRAYLLVESAARLGEHTDHPEFLVVVRNFGQTPAYGVRTWISVTPAERGGYAPLPGPEQGLVEASDAALGPGGTFELAKRYEVDWDPEKFEEFLSGRTTMYVYGEVSYRDAFRRRRYTRFRAMYGAEHFRTGGLSIAARGNESN
jgi:hypothetical protein